MSDRNVVRFWKDADYRASLTAEERAAFPLNPAGPLELADEELADVRGGTLTIGFSILLSCWDTLCSCNCTEGLECGFQTAKVCE